jgi:DNA-binding CsgD family transcriptional regulator
VALALVNGLSSQEYVEQRGRSIHTVRAQLKAAATKVGASRQADFVRTILMGPAMLQLGRRA